MFTANVTAGTYEPTYEWIVDGGEIVSGQGTPSITAKFDEKTLGSKKLITARIGGAPSTCACPADYVVEYVNGRRKALIDPITIHSIGHGRHGFDYFLELLRLYEIEFLCDVRSVARSRWPQFHGGVLRELLAENGIGYEHLPETGGKTKPEPEDLARGIDRIVEIASDVRTVMMCSESQPLSAHKTPRANCHRVGMLAPMLRAKGVDRIVHILPDGRSLEADESLFPSIW